MTRLHTIIGLILAAAATPLANAQEAVHVTQAGSFDPNGASTAPYDTIRAGLAELDARGGQKRLALSAGIYSETMTLSEPMVITNPSQYSAFVGPMGSQSTQLEVATFNTHLYGDALPEEVIDALVFLEIIGAPLHWLEDARANEITAKYRDSTADVVGLQEVWDVDYMGSIPNGANYWQFLAGSLIDFSETPGPVWVPPFGHVSLELNSGLVTMARIPMVSAQQVFFNTESGSGTFFEPYASKGWLRTEVEKDGIRIAIYNLHAQAGPETDPAIKSTRQAQLAQLQWDVIAYRNANPSVPVILLGDFNVRGSGSATSEYMTTLRGFFDTTTLPFVDAARSDRVNRHLNGVTSDDNNKLGVYFGGDAGDKRLDYVLYAHSRNGRVRLVHESTQTIKQRGSSKSHDGVVTTELSDHWAVHTKFRVVKD